MARKRLTPVKKKTARNSPAEEEPLTDDEEEGLEEGDDSEEEDEDEEDEEEDGEDDDSEEEDDEEESEESEEEEPEDEEEAEEEAATPVREVAAHVTVTRVAKAPKSAGRSSPFMIYERKNFKARRAADEVGGEPTVIEIPALVPLDISVEELLALTSTAKCQSWMRKHADRLEGKIIEIHQIKQCVALKLVTKLVISEIE